MKKYLRKKSWMTGLLPLWFGFGFVFLCARLKSKSKGITVQRHSSYLKGLGSTKNITTNWKGLKKREKSLFYYVIVR